ncbi:hypothetical protein Tco_0877389 [Tanacetum coccineum]|uniref:Uncharacterized protein n=1 Tax=Tanacetum coccineum TaxID=301880 RepID=A0ABQ5BWF7_9ASTR
MKFLIVLSEDTNGSSKKSKGLILAGNHLLDLYQASPKESHLIAMKRIFSTSSALPILKDNYLFWSAIKQQSVAMSSAEAEYVAAIRNTLGDIPKLPQEFWCTAIAYDTNPPANDSKVCPLKEYKIKFTMMNGKNPLTLEFKTFVYSTSLDYNEGTYVSHPTLEVVKAELAKIVMNLILLDRTPILKTAFRVAWRILFTFIIQGLEASGALFMKRTKPKYKNTTLRPKQHHLTSSEVELDFEPLKLTSMADFQALLGDDDLKEDSDDDVFEAGEEIDEDNQGPKTEETQSHHSTKHTNEEEHQNFQQILNLFKTNHNTSLRMILENIREIHNVVKEDPALNKKVLEATEAYTKNSTTLTELLTLMKTFDLSGLKSLTESLKVVVDAQNDHLAKWTKSSTSIAWSLGPRLTNIELTHS